MAGTLKGHPSPPPPPPPAFSDWAKFLRALGALFRRVVDSVHGSAARLRPLWGICHGMS